jgi:hypothetical protein
MRDIIWTIIGLWLLWRIIDAFRSFSSSSKKVRNSSTNNQNYNQNAGHSDSQSAQPKKGELKSDAGEYVDYEEIK